MIKTLCTAEFDPVWAEKMEKMTLFDRVGFSLDKDPASRMGPEEITRALQGYDVFLCGYEKVTREVLARCPDLKLILSVRDGPEENIDMAACTELGIPVYSSSGRCMRSVPEFTMLAMLLMAKPAMASASVIRREGWTAENDLKLRRICEASTELSGKTLGIIGLGRNGQALLAQLQAGRLRAALDVFDHEPLGPHSPWYQIPEDRLLLTSHLAGLSVERITFQSRQLWTLLRAVLTGACPTPCNPQVLKAPAFSGRGGALFGVLPPDQVPLEEDA